MRGFYLVWATVFFVWSLVRMVWLEDWVWVLFALLWAVILAWEYAQFRVERREHHEVE